MIYTKSQAIQIVRLLRYRDQDLKSVKCTYMQIRPIAKLLNKSYSYVQNICTTLTKEVDKPQIRRAEVRLGNRAWLA